jgi:phosphotransferase system HPr-like phosphotransfer protein
LGATQGSQVAVEATGPDAEAAVAELVQLVTSGFPDESGKTEAEASHF